MSIVDVRDDIVDAIQTALPSLVWVEATGGGFSEAELRRKALQAPGVLVACEGASDGRNEGGDIAVTWAWSAYVFTRSTSSSSRDAQALVFCEALAGAIAENRWGRSDTHKPQRIRARNLYSGELDRQGVAIWAVTWDQAVDYTPASSSSTDPFSDFVAEWDLAPEDDAIEATDTVSLQTNPPEPVPEGD
jgi:phage gp37-like protein